MDIFFGEDIEIHFILKTSESLPQKRGETSIPTLILFMAPISKPNFITKEIEKRGGRIKSGEYIWLHDEVK